MARKGMMVQILVAKSGNCANGGISDHVDHVVVTHPALDQIFEPSDRMPEVRLVANYVAGEMYVCAVPVNAPFGKNLVGPMFGGAYITTSDSRWGRFLKKFGWNGPVPLHDRWDTQELYDMLSR